jgi:hypothetical protein
MDTKMKELMPPKKEYGQRTMNVYYLSRVAWNFAHAILWSEQKFTDDEVKLVKEHLLTYFRNATHRKKALIAFCERIILTEKHNAAKEQKVMPAPSVWFNPKYYQGFAETKAWHDGIVEKRSEVPGFLKHYTVFASHYYLYSLHPSKSILSQCREKLMALKAKSILELFYKTIYHFNYINQ